jgi:serine/threonine protein kinase
VGITTAALATGVTLGGRYRLEEHIATGGMSEVWRATDVTLGRRVAVKVLPPSLTADPDFVARFRSEARLMAVLHHPGIADVYDAGESELGSHGQALYLVMEHVDGQPLSRRIAEAGRLQPDAVMLLVARAAQALHVAHEHGIVHRDVKPGNLLVTVDGNVVLVDFGVARSAAVTAITSANAVVGTALYMAPEQATGRPVSPATDIYSLGVSAYHCLAGQPPFPGDNPLEVAFKHVHDPAPALPPDIPEPVRTLVERALAKDPAARYASAAAFAAAAVAAMSPDAEERDTALSWGTSAFPLLATAEASAARPRGAGPATAADLTPVPSRRHRRALIGGGAAAVLLAALIIGVMLLRPNLSDGAQRVEQGTPTVAPTGAVNLPTINTSASLSGISGAGDEVPFHGPSASASASGAPSGTPSPTADGPGATPSATPSGGTTPSTTGSAQTSPTATGNGSPSPSDAATSGAP